MSTIDTIASRIIKEQELIIGSLAWDEARKVHGINVTDSKSGQVHVQNGDPREVINKLVNQYELLFGRASREVCRQAVAGMVSQLQPTEVPSSLA
ncbi:MAG TPA: hypothetical protein VJJ24_03575 [Candidatus Paceibacterota bacterium]